MRRKVEVEGKELRNLLLLLLRFELPELELSELPGFFVPGPVDA